MAQSKKSAPDGTNALYLMDANFIFRHCLRNAETDLPQPVDGEARCYIAPRYGSMIPTPYRGPDDLRSVIYRTKMATGAWWMTDADVEELVDFYSETWEDYAGRLARLNKQINDINRRDSSGLEALCFALAA
ncbi:hypothetical protein [Ruegeria arenilitoris]|uniref:Uncharacterized protein n=1 Tax=Ruegeria arenilitoris TaxID=1173585 RepID=A0A238K0P9_9RHOB|nr:hypothetical protein [Ruegeria arenilitoris]SMX36488.1 hypothetical protein RUA8715_01416 [Ruegeria arenilitoris]